MPGSRFRAFPAILLLSACSVASAQSKRFDPFFWIDYDPSKIHFEVMPATLPKQCADLRNRYTRAWVYAHVKTADTEYYILYGDIHGYPEDDNGVTVAIRGSKCLTDDTYSFYAQDVDPVSKTTPISASSDVFEALSSDLLERYVKAFGSKADFLKSVDPRSLRENELPAVLKARFESFARVP
ncbi:MAG TPA: hypothetical protein VIY69_01400 [Candidatus Acidoferrales bacterium]